MSDSPRYQSHYALFYGQRSGHVDMRACLECEVSWVFEKEGPNCWACEKPGITYADYVALRFGEDAKNRIEQK